MDLSLLFTIALIFLVTLIGAYVRSRVKDRCLKSFERHHVTLEKTGGKLVWGVMRLEPTGLEFTYLDSVQDENHIESTYLLYACEYPEIQAIYRYEDGLSEWGRKQRAKDIQRAFHPGPFRRMGRWVRNFLITATDSLNEVLGMVVGRVQKTGARYLTAEGSGALTKLGGKVLGQVGNIYDPLLERYIGHRVVIELTEDNETHEHVGIFKEYSADFIEVLDIQYPQAKVVPLSANTGIQSQQLSATLHKDRLRVTNQDAWPILIRSVQGAETEELINAVVDTGETIDLNVRQHGSDRVRLNIQVVRELDLIVPRSRCVVRHRAEAKPPAELADEIFDLIFDLGTVIREDEMTLAREKRLREELARNPKDALAAANLGGLLLQRDAAVEAEKWLRLALTMEYSLPDGGRRARMQLRELTRRTSEDGAHRVILQETSIPLEPAADIGPQI